jgi:hypothetical protein
MKIMSINIRGLPRKLALKRILETNNLAVLLLQEAMGKVDSIIGDLKKLCVG